MGRLGAPWELPMVSLHDALLLLWLVLLRVAHAPGRQICRASCVRAGVAVARTVMPDAIWTVCEAQCFRWNQHFLIT